MKTLQKIFVVMVAMFAYSCATDLTNDLNVPVGNEVKTTLTLSLEESRVQLGEKTGVLYPLYWSAGDAIAVNGTVSSVLTDEQAGKSGATFSFESELEYPYNIVYPAPSEEAIDKVETTQKTDPETGDVVVDATTGEPVTEDVVVGKLYPVVFPATHNYVAGNIDPQSVPMYGYAESADADTPTLNHLTGLIRLAVVGNGETLTSLTLKSEKGAIAGTYYVDCASGALVAKENSTSNTVTMSFGDGVELKSEATPIYIAVPVGSYGTFMVTLHTATDKMTLKFNSDIKPIGVGTVREFKEFTYAANTADEDSDVFLIDSEEALVEFAKIASAFHPRTAAKVVANIDMSKISAEDLAAYFPIANYGAYSFDGGSEEGYTISNLTTPLFGTTAANIKNVKLTGVNVEVTDLAKSGALVCSLHDGSLTNCEAEGVYSINNTTFTSESVTGEYNDICHGSLAGYVSGSAVTNCTNNIDITVTSFCAPAFEAKTTLGGIVGSASHGSSFDTLINNGTIVFNGTSQLGNLYISGIVGRATTTANQTPIIGLSNCSNTATISTTEGSKCENSLLISGITGSITREDSDPYALCDNLTNTADITHCGECNSLRLAGIICYDAEASITNCSNSGNITVPTGAKTKSAYISGLFSGTNRVKNLAHCTNSGTITIGDDIAFNGYVRMTGIADTITGAEAVITDLTNKAPLSIGSCTNTATGNGGRLYMSGIIFSANSGTFTNCVNEATGTITAKVGSWAARLMIGSVAAYGSHMESVENQIISFTDCENKADIYVESSSSESGYFGGLTAETYAPATAKSTFKYIRSHNSGKITVKGTFTTSGMPHVGGLVATPNHPSYVLDSCNNTGDITVTTVDTQNIYVGGVIGIETNKGSLDVINCTNSATITSNGIITKLIHMGGILGAKTSQETPTKLIGCINTGKVICAGEQTVSNEEISYRIGGIVGYTTQPNLSITNCTNGVEDDTTGKGTVTIGTAPGGVGLGGIMGASGAAITITGCKNYGDVTQTGKGSYNKEYRSHIAGVLGYGFKGDVTITDCENYGLVEYGTVKPNNRVDVAGITATTTGTNTISGCKNGGTVKYGASSSQEICVAGIVGCPQGTTLITDCHNLASGVVWGAGTVSTNYDIGGIAGGPSGSGSQIVGCNNYGTIKQTAKSSSSVNFGGIVGYGYSYKLIDKCENHGTFEIAGTSAGMKAGGIIGYSRLPKSRTSDATVSNCVNRADLTFGGEAGTTYCGGGIVGYSTRDPASTGTLWNTGNINLGNLTYTCTCATPYFGGIIGLIERSEVKDCQSYCTITAIGFTGKVGMILGTARAEDSVVATNCGVGGTICTETGENDEGETYNVEQVIEATNYFNYIYAGTTTWAEGSDYDGCTFLSVAPTVGGTTATE